MSPGPSGGRAAGRPWLVCIRRRAGAQLRLICLPAGGSGASTYRPWDAALPSWVELWSVTAPGREQRVSETPPGRLSTYADHVATELSRMREMPLLLFGHSMGAMVAYEVARRIEAEGAPALLGLVVSAMRAPGAASEVLIEHTLADDALLESVRRRYGGFPAEVDAHPELLELALRVLRADLHALETHRAEDGALAVPIDAIGGDRDPSVSVADLEAWRAQTTASFSLRLFPGDHRYVETSQADVLAWLRRRMRELI